MRPQIVVKVLRLLAARPLPEGLHLRHMAGLRLNLLGLLALWVVILVLLALSNGEFGAFNSDLKVFGALNCAFDALDGAFGTFGALDGAFGALNGAFGACL